MIARNLQKWLKTILTFGGGIVLLAVLLFVHINQGSVNLSSRVIVEAIFFPQDILEHHTVRYLRLPRAVIGVLAGGGLAVAGAVLQTITKNPLASASTLGIHAGSYFAVVFSTVFLPSSFLPGNLSAAFIGGILTAMLVYGLAGGSSANPVKMVLAGMVVTILFSALTSLLQLFFENETAGLFLWGSGTLIQNNWQGVSFSTPFILFGMLAILAFSKQLDAFRLGEDVASSLGQNVRRLRLSAWIIAVFLTSVTVSVVGPIGFVGLIAPHLIKLLGFQKHGVLLTASFIWGANVLVGADVLARFIDTSNSELPVGAITALIGSPWLIWLVIRKKSQGYGDKSTALLSGRARLAFSSSYFLPILLGLLLVALVIGASTGNNGVQMIESFRAFTSDSNDFIRNMILDIRLPRMVVAAFSGALLAISGFVFQGVLRNPLADPSVIGITSGAGVGALLVIFTSWLPASFVPIGAFTGAIVTFLVVMALSYRANFQPSLLALLGIGVSAFGSALIQIMIVRADMAVASALVWLSGTTYATGWDELINFLIWPFIIFVPLLYLQINKLGLLALGDDTAKGLGLRVSSTRFWMALTASFIAAASVSAVGAVSFVGLIAPHLARMFLGPAHRLLLPASALLGALLLMIADILSRTLLVPKEIPSGTLIAIIGAPYFLWLMYRSTKIKS